MEEEILSFLLVTALLLSACPPRWRKGWRGHATNSGSAGTRTAPIEGAAEAAGYEVDPSTPTTMWHPGQPD